MQELLERALGLTDRELRRALPLFVFLFLTMAGSVASKAARDALFLDRYRAIDLPYVDIAIALLVGIAAALYIRLGQRTNLRNLQVASLLFFAATALIFWLWVTLSTESGPLFIIIYIWVGVFSVLAPSQVWTLANYVMTTREAKKSFGFIGSGAILGWIVGGLATRTAASHYGTESLLVFVAVSLIASAFLVVIIWRGRPDSLGADQPASGVDAGGGILDSLALIHGSKYLRAIAWVILLSAFATTVAGWQFKAIAKASIPATDELAMFFGTFNMTAGLVSLVLQILLTSRVLRTVGVGSALFIVPTAIMASSFGVIAFGTLTAAALLKASDQVLRYSIDKSTVELLYLPVPASQTFRAKSFIDTVVYRSGDAMGGLAVLLFAAVLGWSPMQVGWVCLVLIGGWFVAAFVARRQYVENLRESIHQHRVDAERASLPVIDRDTSALLSSHLKGATREIAYALSIFEHAHDRVLHPAVKGLLKHQDPAIRCKAISLLSRAGDVSVKGEIEKLLCDPSLDVRTEALMYLTALDQHTDPLTRIEALGDFEDFSIRAALVAFLARPGRTQNIDAAKLLFSKMVDEPGLEGMRTRLEASRLLAILPDVFDREMRALVDDEAPEIAREAILAAGKCKKRTLVDRLIERLAEPDLADCAAEALAMFGDRIVGTLRDYLTDAEMPMDVRRQIPSVLQNIGTRAAQTVLSESVLDRDVVLRYHVITALNKLGQQHPERAIDRKLIESVLAAEIMGHYRSYQVLGTLGTSLEEAGNPILDGLRESMDKEAERVFRLMKLLYPEYDMHSAYVGLQSSDPVVHDNAVEFLDSVLPPQMRTLLIPLFDRDVSVDQRIAAANRLVGSALGDREEAVEVMSLSQDPWLRSCAAYAIGEMHLQRFAKMLDDWASHADPLLRATAIDAREKLRLAQNA